MANHVLSGVDEPSNLIQILKVMHPFRILCAFPARMLARPPHE